RFHYYSLSLLDALPISINKIVKRTFDVALSIFVLVFILSWLTPLMAIVIKLDSKGAVFFKQKRNGLDNKEFYCYKFRSIHPNPDADLYQVSQIGRAHV